MYFNNSVQLIGNLGQDPVVRTLDSGRMMTSLRLATTNSYENNNGQKIESTQWHNCVAWGKQAQVMGKYLAKGARVALKGRLEYRQFVDKEGKKREATNIVINDFMFLGSHRQEQQD